jgi:hypothetical protein
MGLFNLLFGSSEVDSSPSVNIDGTPMCGDLDAHGNLFGVTSADNDISTCSLVDDTFSCVDDSFSSFDDSSCSGFDDW